MIGANRNWARTKDAWRVRILGTDGKTIEFEERRLTEREARAMAKRQRIKHSIDGRTVLCQHRRLGANRYRTVEP